MSLRPVVHAATLALCCMSCGSQTLPGNATNTAPRNATRPRLGPDTGLLQGSVGPVRNMDGAATVTDLSADGTNTVLLVTRSDAGVVILELQTGFPTSDERYQREGTYTFGLFTAPGPTFTRLVRVVAHADADPERDSNRVAYTGTASTGVMMVSPANTPGFRRVDLLLEFPDEAEAFSATFLLPGEALPPVEQGSPPTTPEVTMDAPTVRPTAWMNGSVGYVHGMDQQATALTEMGLWSWHITVTARQPGVGVTMAIINLFMTLTPETLVPGTVYAMGNGMETFSILGCSDRDATMDPYSVEFDAPADDGTITVEEGPTPDTRILQVRSMHLDGPTGRTDMTTQLTVQLPP